MEITCANCKLSYPIGTQICLQCRIPIVTPTPTTHASVKETSSKDKDKKSGKSDNEKHLDWFNRKKDDLLKLNKKFINSKSKSSLAISLQKLFDAEPGGSVNIELIKEVFEAIKNEKEKDKGGDNKNVGGMTATSTSITTTTTAATAAAAGSKTAAAAIKSLSDQISESLEKKDKNINSNSSNINNNSIINININNNSSNNNFSNIISSSSSNSSNGGANVSIVTATALAVPVAPSRPLSFKESVDRLRELIAGYEARPSKQKFEVILGKKQKNFHNKAPITIQITRRRKHLFFF